jgi:hypothetical protein
MSRKANAERPRQELVSEHSRHLTPAELTHARLRLSQEMVNLVLSDTDALPVTMQVRLERLATMLDEVLKHARRLS